MNLKEIEAVYSKVQPFIHKTPLIRSKALEKEIECPHALYLKCENKQITGSFKVRGASYALLRLSDEDKERGVITRSSGNFSGALAFLTFQMGIKSTLVIGESTPEFKRAKSQKYQSEVIVAGKSHAESMQKVNELIDRYHYTLLHSFDHPDVIRGQGTLAYEIWKENPKICSLLIPLGGGGLSAGCAQTFKTLNPESKVYTVEPNGANDFVLSRQKGSQLTLDSVNTIADGLRAPSVGRHNWPILKEFINEAYQVSDEEILKAMWWAYEHHYLVLEPSAAAALALLLADKKSFKPTEPTAIVLTGGNISEVDFFEKIKPFEAPKKASS